MGGSNNRNLFLTVVGLEAERRTLANLVPDENLLLGWNVVIYCHMAERKIISFMTLLLRALIPFMRAPPS